jgi:hypothetical protein
MKTRSAAALTLVGLAVLLAGLTLGTATASPIKWLLVPLATHQFGHQRTPDTIVAHAGPDQVGFKKTGDHCGCTDGPEGPMLFDVGRDGSVWLFDVINHRLLVWERGRPLRSLALPKLDVRDFALGTNGTVYLYAVYAEPPAGDSGANLWALSPKGAVLWRAHAEMGTALRLGPDGALYSIGASKRHPAAWTPLTTPGGRPLSLAIQRRRTVPFQPLGGGLRLIVNTIGVHEVHFALVDRAHRIVRAWRVTSRTPVAPALRALTPALVAGDLVVQLDVSRQAKGVFLWEHEILRLTRSGSRTSFALDAKAVYGDDGAEPIDALRVAPNGRLYQLRTNPSSGVSIARYSLGG